MTTLVMESPRTKLLSVLLVEDNLIDARLVSAFLHGHSETLDCKHVGRLDEALQILRGVQFDVILLDLNLEDSLGYETFFRIQQVASRASIIVLSGSDDEELAIRTVREGAQDYLVKGSFDGRLLQRSIRYAFERKQAEEALRESEATVRAIFENSLDGIIITDDRALCIEANPAAAGLFGLPREKVNGTSLLSWGGDDLQSEWRRSLCLGRGQGRFWIQRRDGEKRLADCTFNANILSGKHVIALRDVTEQQSLEEQLRQSQKMEAVGRLAGGVAHDFNNILGIISGYAELLQINGSDQAQKTRAEKVLTAIEKAAALTKQLLALARGQDMAPKLLDVGAVVSELSGMIRCMVGAEIQLVLHGAKSGMVNADQGQLEQVILNLAANARDAMPEGGVLTITLDSYASVGTGTNEPPLGDYILISVEDTGIGMDPATQSRIFEPFFTTKRTGSGLGLSTVYGIVKQSGGHIEVESMPDAGSTFRVFLPRAIGSAIPAPKVEPEKPAHLQGSETVLLVDDEEELRNAVAEYLEGCGYRVLTARNGREAIDLADRFDGNISLLISDIVMPKTSGRGLLDHFRKTRPETRALVISGYADDAAIHHGILLETTCFLQKPFTLQLLGAKIRKLLDR
jgi:two-component system, cell cycle sensor histidine kinase and response regulator CckA